MTGRQTDRLLPLASKGLVSTLSYTLLMAMPFMLKNILIKKTNYVVTLLMKSYPRKHHQYLSFFED